MRLVEIPRLSTYAFVLHFRGPMMTLNALALRRRDVDGGQHCGGTQRGSIVMAERVDAHCLVGSRSPTPVNLHSVSIQLYCEFIFFALCAYSCWAKFPANSWSIEFSTRRQKWESRIRRTYIGTVCVDNVGISKGGIESRDLHLTFLGVLGRYRVCQFQKHSNG